MLPIKRILCPIDFSTFSEHAVSRAVELARHFHAELCLLHVAVSVENAYCLDAYGGSGLWNIEPYEEEVTSAAELELAKVAARPEFSGCEIQTIYREGNTSDEIITCARDFDLIVIATHGLGSWRHVMFGSVAEKVIHGASCQVLVVHAPKPCAISQPVHATLEPATF